MEVVLLLLSALFIGVIFMMNIMTNSMGNAKEGFANEVEPIQESPLAPRIRAVLDPMATPYANDLCDLYATIRDVMKKNVKAEKKVDDREAERLVEADLQLKIPGGALSCPLLKYPRAGAGDMDWLQWLQKIPKDFGARVVLMAEYANTSLAENKKGLEDALSGKAVETFQDICTPDVAETRRMEASKKQQATCILPEDADPKTIQKQVDSLLQTLVKEKMTILKAKSINPSQDIGPWIASAKQSAAWLNQKKQDAESGALIDSVQI